MVIKGEHIFSEEGGFRKGSIEISDNKIKKTNWGNNMATPKDEVLEVGEWYVVPGLVDIHFHGCMGVDFCDGTYHAMDVITKYELEHGITSIVPATMTLSKEELATIFENAGKYKSPTGSTIRGITMEGPFVSMAKKGAQNGQFIYKPDMEFYRQMQQISGGMIRQVAVAPEEDENFAFIQQASKECVVSVAHTTAGYDIAKEAFERGASHVTHLFNAMTALQHRNPGVVGAALSDERVSCELIADTFHVNPGLYKLVAKAKGDKLCLITDCMRAGGMDDGDYTLGGQHVIKTGIQCLLEDGTIAGSVLKLNEAVRNLRDYTDLSLSEVFACASLNPAKVVGEADNIGSLEVGKCADIIICDDNINVITTIINGEIFE